MRLRYAPSNRKRSPSWAVMLLLALTSVVTVPRFECFLALPCPAPTGSRLNSVERESSSTRASPGVIKNPTLERPTISALAGEPGDGSETTEGGPGSSGSSSSRTYTCRNCNQQFRREDNGPDACSYHPGVFTGRLNRVNDVDTSGLEYFWSCCGESDPSHPGCVVGSHVSYDDPPEGGDGAWRSPLTGTLR